MILLTNISELLTPLDPEETFGGLELIKLSLSFGLNFLMVWIICHFLYYPKGHRRDYYFTFILLSVAIFMMIYLMNGSQMEIGAALGLFAVFGILRYRTESVPIREMTYLFYLVAISVVNGSTDHMDLLEKLMANVIFLGVVWGSERFALQNKVGCKYVKYDNIKLITPDKSEELKADLEKRLGVKVQRVEVGAVDFIKDMTMLRVYYIDNSDRLKTVDHMTNLKDDNAFE